MAKKKTPAAKAARAKSEEMLDNALAASFPASDPVSVETALIPGSHPVKKPAKAKRRG